MPGTISVGWTSTADLTASDLTNLSRRLPEPEQERAAAMPREGRRGRFVIGRLLARAVAGAVTRSSSHAVGIAVEPTGQPVVVEPTRLFLSITHSGERVVAAVADRPVGVDVERVRDAPLNAKLAARVCSVTELKTLETMPDADRQRAFLSIWTRKEAYGKALGIGMDFPWRSVTTDVAGLHLAGVPGRWLARNLDIGSGYVAAVVSGAEGVVSGAEGIDLDVKQFALRDL